MVWAEEEPQFQFAQAGAQDPGRSIMERLLSAAVVAREQPGK
jgi:hypothetical protein